MVINFYYAQAVVVTFVLLSQAASSFLILSHHPLVSQRLDPIISNGTSSPVHQFVGTSVISPQMDSASLEQARKSKSCQTAGVGADQFSYWAPKPCSYDENNETFTSVPHSYSQTYYLQRPDSQRWHSQSLPRGWVTNSGVQAVRVMKTAKHLILFLPRSEMIAGNASAISPDPESQASKAVSFVCQEFKSGSSQHDSIPAGSCPDGLRTQVRDKIRSLCPWGSRASIVLDWPPTFHPSYRLSFHLAGMEPISILPIIRTTCITQIQTLQITATVRRVTQSSSSLSFTNSFGASEIKPILTILVGSW